MQPALQLALLLAILLPSVKLVASLCRRVGVPPIIGELLVGVVFGPGIFHIAGWLPFKGGEATNALSMLAQIGGYVLMFIAGVETDIESMREASVTAFFVALSGVIWPFLLGAGVGHLLGLSWTTACFLGGALTATSVSISARTLMDEGKMSSPEATVILGAAVIDDVMGLFVLAILAATVTTAGADTSGVAPIASRWLRARYPLAGAHPLIVQLTAISICVAVYFFVAYGAAKRWLDPLILQLRKLTADEAVPSCIFALTLIYAVSAEWFGSVAGITGAYLLGYVFAESEFKADVERSFYAIGHGFLIPLFFVSIGLLSDYRALPGHWALLFWTLLVAIIGKLVGCGSAALGSGMDWVRSLRVGFGMMSRGEVGLIVTVIGVTSGILKPPEVAVMVAVVLLTTLLTPLALRGAYALKSRQDIEEGLFAEPVVASATESGAGLIGDTKSDSVNRPPRDTSLKMAATSNVHVTLTTGCKHAPDVK